MIKILTFIPFIALFTVMIYEPKETGINNVIILVLSALIQAVSISALLILIF